MLLGKRPPEGLLGGLHEPPMFRVTEGGLEAGLSQGLRAMGLQVSEAHPCGQIRHVLTHRVMEIHRFEVALTGTVSPGPYAHAMWVSASDLEGLALSTLARKALG